jgi:hypothetical protein
LLARGVSPWTTAQHKCVAPEGRQNRTCAQFCRPSGAAAFFRSGTRGLHPNATPDGVPDKVFSPEGGFIKPGVESSEPGVAGVARGFSDSVPLLLGLQSARHFPAPSLGKRAVACDFPGRFRRSVLGIHHA